MNLRITFPGKVLVECQSSPTIPSVGQEMTFHGYQGDPLLEGYVFVVEKVRLHFTAADPSETEISRQPMASAEKDLPFIHATVYVDCVALRRERELLCPPRW
jgi:hypothetical protein